jgi:phytoene desaturase
MHKNVVIIGSGLGGLATALRLSSLGYQVTILEKASTPGGRLNILERDGYRFDMGPSFMSMTYELDELFASINEPQPIELEELDPLYQVYFQGQERPRQIWKSLDKLALEFADIEPDLAPKADAYLKRAGMFFHDTENTVIRSNFDSKLKYLIKLARLPLKHVPYLYKTIWSEVEKTFSSEEVRIIFSLVAFFLGSTPFKTPSIYSLLNYTEMKHNGYWRVKGGMYSIVQKILPLLEKRGVRIHYNTEIVRVNNSGERIVSCIDSDGKEWRADIFVSNSDAASFRGKILGREKFTEKKLDAMHWTLAPFTLYLGVKGKMDELKLHNYFLGSNFRTYADTIFTSAESPDQPYYYVNALSKTEPDVAPEGCESLFVLCPVPDLRFKSDWSDKDVLADRIIADLSSRIHFDIKSNLQVKIIKTPCDWEKAFNLYRGSGLGLAHDILQVGAFRPKNKDEEYHNLYYVGASTTPGTGLPMVIISSKLVTERVVQDDRTI